MKNETASMTVEQKALAASFQLHNEMMYDCCYAGYEGDKVAFDRLYEEVLVICAQELPDDADLDQVNEMFHEYQLEQMNGDRDICWFLY